MRRKTAAVYDRWLFTLGGGEQVAFAYAESLRDLGYETSILTHKEFDRVKAQRKMGVNLKGIKIVQLPQMHTTELSQYTEKYDVFINNSYLDYFPNRSKSGVLSIFFPTQVVLTPLEFLKRGIVVPAFRKFFIYPVQYDGFRYDEYKRGTLFKWMSKESFITLNQPVSAFTLVIFAKTLGVSLVDGISFYFGNKKISPAVRKIGDNTITFRFHLPQASSARLKVVLPDSKYAKEVALVRFTIHSFRYKAYNIFKRLFSTWEMRLHGGPAVTKLSDLSSYQRIITISEFSKQWITKFWGLRSSVLYPPVSVANFSPSKKKKNMIVHVGRFFVTGHCKKQLDLVKVFRRLVDEKGLKGWELHFVGSVHEGKKHQEYFEQVKYFATGYPVYFHLDAPFSELKSVLGQAKIYWHATGLDENEQENPILFEHFGITTVEAMASGCVPVVIHAGGQKEIVTKDSGFTWKTRDELLSKTLLLTNDDKLLARLAKGAISRSVFFSRRQFQTRFKKLLKHS